MYSAACQLTALLLRGNGSPTARARAAATDGNPHQAQPGAPLPCAWIPVGIGWTRKAAARPNVRSLGLQQPCRGGTSNQPGCAMRKRGRSCFEDARLAQHRDTPNRVPKQRRAPCSRLPIRANKLPLFLSRGRNAQRGFGIVTAEAVHTLAALHSRIQKPRGARPIGQRRTSDALQPGANRQTREGEARKPACLWACAHVLHSSSASSKRPMKRTFPLSSASTSYPRLRSRMARSTGRG